MKGKLGLLQPAELMDLLEEYAPEDGETAGAVLLRRVGRLPGPGRLTTSWWWGLDAQRRVSSMSAGPVVQLGSGTWREHGARTVSQREPRLARACSLAR